MTGMPPDRRDLDPHFYPAHERTAQLGYAFGGCCNICTSIIATIGWNSPTVLTRMPWTGQTLKADKRLLRGATIQQDRLYSVLPLP